jgi:hypothetical protein
MEVGKASSFAEASADQTAGQVRLINFKKSFHPYNPSLKNLHYLLSVVDPSRERSHVPQVLRGEAFYATRHASIFSSMTTFLTNLGFPHEKSCQEWENLLESCT